MLSRVLERVTVTSYRRPRCARAAACPRLVEADNLGTYVLKFRGAGHGPLALIAEIIGGELARRLGLRTPELALAELDPRIAASEPDPEIQDLLRASVGLNLAVDFLPGSAGFDPLGWTVDADFASEVLWFDALIQNVDRTWRNPNLLVWHGDIWLIDHGAALYFHHDWSAGRPRQAVRRQQHVLRDRASRIAQAHEQAGPADHGGRCRRGHRRRPARLVQPSAAPTPTSTSCCPRPAAGGDPPAIPPHRPPPPPPPPRARSSSAR